MMMQLAHKLKEPNALNFFKLRRVNSLPPYFDSTTIPYTYNIEESLNKWVQRNLKGRYYLNRSTSVSSITDTIESSLKVGFEDTKEMSYFMLACPLLKYK